MDLYINDNKVKYDKFFIPEKEGIYIIRLIKIDLFSFDIRNNTNIKNMF